MTSPKKFTYGDVGVDTIIEAEAARLLFKYAKETWSNRKDKLGDPVQLVDSFSGARFTDIASLSEGTVSYGNADGVGTKPELARVANRYDTIATDLVAMVADDAAILGAEPAHLITVLKVNTLGKDKSRLSYIEDLARGYIPACADAGVAVINGEIAQHNNVMGDMDDFRFEWDATLTWYAHKTRLLDGSRIKNGDYLIGLQEDGLRCNGISLVRKILSTKLGSSWGETKHNSERLADLAIRPSKIYTKAIVDMTGGYDLARSPKAKLSGAVHITGGGIPEKLVYRLLNRLRLGAIIDDPFEPGELLQYCQKLGQVSDEEAYRTWNMGQGMVLISPSPKEVLRVCEVHGIPAKIIGHITSKPEVVIHSKGLHGSVLRF